MLAWDRDVASVPQSNVYLALASQKAMWRLCQWLCFRHRACTGAKGVAEW